MDEAETAGSADMNSERSSGALAIAIDLFPIAFATLLLLIVYVRVTD